MVYPQNPSTGGRDSSQSLQQIQFNAIGGLLEILSQKQTKKRESKKIWIMAILNLVNFWSFRVQNSVIIFHYYKCLCNEHLCAFWSVITTFKLTNWNREPLSSYKVMSGMRTLGLSGELGSHPPSSFSSLSFCCSAWLFLLYSWPSWGFSKLEPFHLFLGGLIHPESNILSLFDSAFGSYPLKSSLTFSFCLFVFVS